MALFVHWVVTGEKAVRLKYRVKLPNNPRLLKSVAKQCSLKPFFFLISHKLHYNVLGHGYI